MMEKLITDFAAHLAEAVEISAKTTIKPTSKEIKNVLLLGLGGSGIGGNIVQTLIENDIKVPFVVKKTYSVPNFVNEHTLVIGCSFSGNTEETLIALEEAKNRGAEIACVTSGGKLLEIAQREHYNHMVLPIKAECPRAHLGFSFVALLVLLEKYNLLQDNYKEDIKEAIALIQDSEEKMHQEAKQVASLLHNKMPFLYGDDIMHGLLVRFQQQINENAKQLCHVNVFPEMNHNELVGWVYPEQTLKEIVVLVFESSYNHPRVNIRFDICKPIFASKAAHVQTIKAEGKSLLAQIVYLIHLTDWVSYYLAVKNNVDPFPVNIILHLKSELSKN